MLPCNVVVQQLDGGQVKVAAIDPVASMQAIDNPQLKEAAARVGEKLVRRGRDLTTARRLLIIDATLVQDASL